MKTIQHTVVIPAVPAAVWRTLTDTERYPEWNVHLLVPLLRRTIRDTEAGFAAMNHALDARVRATAAPTP